MFKSIISLSLITALSGANTTDIDLGLDAERGDMLELNKYNRPTGLGKDLRRGKDSISDKMGRPNPEGEEKEKPRTKKDVLIEKFDTDGDGQLNEDEKKALKESWVTKQKKKNADRRARFISKYDTDGDGKLSDEEKQAARDARKARWESLRTKYGKKNGGRAGRWGRK